MTDNMEARNDERPGQPLLHRASNEELHDVICVGFGPASLAIAIALYDSIEANTYSRARQNVKIRFLEKQQQFAWHPGMLLKDSKMQISFMKDFATLRNPKSRFTFLNYLHTQQRLVSFTNLGSILPRRVEYNDYMRWCASAFGDVVDYGTEVKGVDIDEIDSNTGTVQSFRINSANPATGEDTTLRARHVIVAVGGRPSIPRVFQGHEQRVIHSSQYLSKDLSAALSERFPRRVAVVGGGQSAAEVFYDIPSRFPKVQSILIIRDSALRPSDDSPFVNELFHPERTDDVFYQDQCTRENGITMNKVTNYGVVRSDLLEEIYSAQYSYRITSPEEKKWPHRILSNRSVIAVSSSKQSNVQLKLLNRAANGFNQVPPTENLDVDLVVVACGYDRTAHEDILQGLQTLLPEAPEDERTWNVNRDYSVRFKNNAVQADAGIWLQGCNQSTHGLPDSLLSVLAVRSGEMVKSIFGGNSRNA